MGQQNLTYNVGGRGCGQGPILPIPVYMHDYIYT